MYNGRMELSKRGWKKENWNIVAIGREEEREGQCISKQGKRVTEQCRSLNYSGVTSGQ